MQSPTMRTSHALCAITLALVSLLGCTPADEKCAADRLANHDACQTACDQGHMPSCLAAANTHDERYEAKPSKQEAEQAVRLYERACEGGQLEACASALRGLLQGPSREDPNKTTPDAVSDAPTRRRALLLQACALDDPHWCEEAADAFLGVDGEKAEALGRKACSLEYADRVKRDACETKRAALVQQASRGAEGCASGRPGGCLELANAVVRTDLSRAREAYAKECKRRGLLNDGKTDACVAVYEKAATARTLPAAEPSIADRTDARVLLRSLALDPSKPDVPSAEQIRKVVDEGSRPLQACYAAALGRNSKLSGSLTLLLTIDAFGEPWNIREQDLKLLDLQAVECVKKAAGTWRFPQPSRGTIDVQAHFVFRIER